jgi:hypothetical protein
MTTGSVNGSDLLVYLDSNNDQTPKSFVMRKKLKEEEMIQELYLDYIKDQTPNLFVMAKQNQEEIHKFGETTTVFVANKNLQNCPYQLEGCLIWVKCHSIIAVIIESQGVSAVVSVLYPSSRKGQKVILQDLSRLEGQYLQFVCGPHPNCLHNNFKFRSRKEHETLVDLDGCIKMSVEGGDIVIPEEDGCERKDWDLRKLPKVGNLRMTKLPKKLSNPGKHIRPPKSASCGSSKRKRKSKSKHNSHRTQTPVDVPKEMVDVVYVYRDDPEEYKRVETYVEDGPDKDIDTHLEDCRLLSNETMKVKPVFSIPVGKPYNVKERYEFHVYLIDKY